MSKKTKIKKGTEQIIDHYLLSCRDQAERVFNLRKIKGSTLTQYQNLIFFLESNFSTTFTDKELLEIICDGNGDCNIDAIYLDKTGTVNIIDISNKNLSHNDIILFKQSIASLIVGSDIPKNANETLKKRLLKIKKSKVKKINLLVVRLNDLYATQDANSIRPLEPLFELKRKNKSLPFEIDYFSNKKLIESRFEVQKKLPELVLDKGSKGEKIFIEEDNYIVLLVNVGTLIKYISELGADREFIFHKNVRGNLKNKEISSSIKSTIDRDPDNFHIYHNGITVTCTNFFSQASAKLIIINPQIVNGAQTLHTVMTLSQTKKIKNVKIICKIVIADQLLTEKVCESANTQAPVKIQDLKSNGYEHLLLEQLLELNNICTYRRKKGIRKKTLQGTVQMSKEMFVQAYVACEYRVPYLVKDKLKGLFSTFEYGPPNKKKTVTYEQIRVKITNEMSEEGGTETILKIAQLWQDLTKVRKILKDEGKKKLLKNADMHILSYLYHNRTKLKNLNLEVNNILEEMQQILREDVYKDKTTNQIFTKESKLWDDLIKIKYEVFK